MYDLQPPSKLELLEDQRPLRSRDRRRWILVTVLVLLNAVNVTVIVRKLSGTPAGTSAEASTAGAEAAAPTADAITEATRLDRPLAEVAAAAYPAPAAADLAPSTPAQVTPVSVRAEAILPTPEPTGAASSVGLSHAVSHRVGQGEAVSHRVVSGRLKSGHTIAQALSDAGLSPIQTHEIVGALEGVFNFRKARAGDGFRIKTTPEGQIVFFDYEASPVESYCVRRDGDRLLGYRRQIPVEKKIVMVEGRIGSSLYAALDQIGEDPALAVLFADVLAWDIDFYRDPQSGDGFKVVVEKFLYKDRLLRYGDVLAAQYDGATVGSVRVFRYEVPGERANYFTEAGESAQKALLKAPLKVARITSNYGMRRHPILGYTRAHQGVDYGAPTGTPVWAVGDGTVIWAGRKGANGNLVSLRHANGFVTYYAHLSKILVRSGQRVHQKDVIGLVGNTGRSTGPHLHYGLKKHGSYVNPLALNLPRKRPLTKAQLPAFLESIAPIKGLLDGIEVASLPPDTNQVQ